MAGANQRERGQPINYENEALRLYYQHQAICADEAETERMWERFRTELPVTFRLTCSGALAPATEAYYDNDAIIYDEAAPTSEQAQDPTVTQNSGGQKDDEHASPTAATGESILLDRAVRLSLIPSAYTMGSIDRKRLRKLESMKTFRAHLIVDSERGALQRQELVSMIPPLFLHSSLGDTIIDMCASPGSKTSQILDAVHRDFKKGDDFVLPAGTALLANDIAIERARLLSHQLGKVASPLVATICSDASAMPKAADAATLFTKVLCDVPCTGDGTTRKNYDVWSEWKVTNALPLHTRQLRILIRGLELLAPGGRLVYSTCSLNPIENEAVVASALKHFGAEIKLIDVFEEVPELPAARGLTKWLVPNPMAWFKFSSEEALRKVATRGSKMRRKRSAPSPESEEGVNAKLNSLKDEVKDLPLFIDSVEAAHAPANHIVDTMFVSQHPPELLEELRKTARFLPHYALDSGGFYVAVLERSKESEAPLKKSHRNADTPAPPGTKIYDDTIRVTPLDGQIAEDIIEFYGLSERVTPKSRGGQVADTAALPRAPGSVVPEEISTERGDLRVCAEGCGPTDAASPWLYQSDEGGRRVLLATPRLFEMHCQARNLNFISFGAKVFERLDDRFCETSACDYRVTNDAALWLSGYMRRRLVRLTYTALKDCLDRDGLTRPYLLELEAGGSVWCLDSCRSAATGLLESGGCVLVATGNLGVIRVGALVTGNGNIQPLMKKCLRPGITNILARDVS